MMRKMEEDGGRWRKMDEDGGRWRKIEEIDSSFQEPQMMNLHGKNVLT
jgi:hypothetical protein